MYGKLRYRDQAKMIDLSGRNRLCDEKKTVSLRDAVHLFVLMITVIALLVWAVSLVGPAIDIHHAEMAKKYAPIAAEKKERMNHE